MKPADAAPSNDERADRTGRGVLAHRALAFVLVVLAGALAFKAGAWLGAGVAADSRVDAGRVFGSGAEPLAAATPIPPAPLRRRADFGAEFPSPDALRLADWIAGSNNNAERDFVVIDKKAARIYVFDARAQLRGASPILIGSAIGDDSVAGIGTRPIAAVRPAERTTPAGRFLGEAGRNSDGEDIVWVDYDAAVSIHRVRATNPDERRQQRLATPTSADNRISYGCINVPAAFYDAQIKPVFARHPAPVYVLPEVKAVDAVFGLAAPVTGATSASR